MSDIAGTLARLVADRESGELAALSAEHDVDLLVLFGSALRDPDNARDVDVAFSFDYGRSGDELAVVNALGQRYGDLLDIMPLDRAGVVARFEALSRCDVLVERTPIKFANQQIAAFGEFYDTRFLRRAQLEALAR